MARDEAARLAIERVGGIEETEVTLRPGVSALTGRNATNRTSLLQGLMAALGSDDVSLKGDAEEGRVRLAIGDETYTRTLTREAGGVAFGGDPYAADATAADLFAFLLGSNEVREAVADGEDLRDLIMRSVETDEIRSEIADLRSEHRDLDRRVDEAATLESELPALESRRDDVEAAIADLESQLEERRATLARVEGEAGGGGDARERLERLQSASADLDEVEFELDAERESLAALEDEAADLRAELDEYPDAPAERLDAVESDLADLRDRKQELDAAITDLQRTIEFNERLLDGEESPPVAAGDRDGDEAADGDGVVCWTCGSTVETGEIEATVEQLRTLRRERREERQSVTDRIESLRARRAELAETRRQRAEIESRLDAVEAEREEREARIADLEDRRESLRATVDDLEDAVDAGGDDREALLEAHREVTRLEFELEQRREERESVAAEIAEVRDELDRRDDLAERQTEIESRIDELRGRVEEIERSAVAEFNDHMARVLDVLEYASLSRIWIERRADDPAGRGDLPAGEFVLHIERRTDDGTTYEDVVDHLSESEREVTGLVFAFAGYLVHEVYDDVPFLLLDSLEAVDAERIRKLVDYVRPYADYLVVALLPEDAQALPDSYHRVRDI